MSLSDEPSKLSALAAGLSVEIERTIQSGEVAAIPSSDVTKLLSGAVRLYAALSEEADPGAAAAPAIDGTVSTTEAMIVACALLRAQHLNPFDLALWFQRTAPAPGRDAH